MKVQENREGKDQELIQSGTTPDPGYHMGKGQIHNKLSYTGEPRSQPFAAGNHKAA